ncbi:MAG: TraY domain-containing protein [Clostridiales bacterium]|nr:TraY domain-containing protein [Clostridiales bacterium]
MEVQFLRYTLRIDRLYFQKFRYIAESEGRSANKEIEQYIKKRVDEFESIYDEIDVEPINPFRVEK